MCKPPKATIPPGDSSLAGRVMKGEQEPSEIFDKFLYLYKNGAHPDKKYSVCMITYNDEECIRAYNGKCISLSCR